MEIPKEIVGRNRVRDTRICVEYINGVSPEEIAVYEWVNLTVRRVYRILFANQPFINPRITWPKARRVWMLQSMIDKAEDSKKDKADLIEQLRREAEGDKKTSNIDTKIIIIRHESATIEGEDSGSKIKSLSRSLPI